MTNQRAYDIRMAFALVEFHLEAEGDAKPERVHDLVQMTLMVNPDDSWTVGVGRSVLLGSHIDWPVHTITGGAEESALSLLRTVAGNPT